MEKLDFKLFSSPVDAKIAVWAKMQSVVLVRADVNLDALYEHYLNSYPQEFNKIFRERREYDGIYDKQYIRRVGNLVAIHLDGHVESLWNVKVPGYFQQVADSMNTYVLSHAFKEQFFTEEPTAGHLPNKDTHSNIVWTHFYSRIPSQFVAGSTLASKVGESSTTIEMFRRALETFTLDALQTVDELCKSASIYRASEFAESVSRFLSWKQKYATLTTSHEKDIFIFYTAIKNGFTTRFRNSVIGTLVEDISTGVDLERAVASYESKVAPTNYKRPTALVTPSMLAQAKETLLKEDLYDSLSRRLARVEDIGINNVLFTSVKEQPLDIFDELSVAASRKAPKVLKDVEQISIQDFITKVVPTAKSIEALVEDRHSSNFMTLVTAEHASAKNLFKWKNPFSWSYKGNVTDAIQERVKKFGGSLEGDLRVSLSWYNSDDLDLSIIEPSSRTIAYNSKTSSSSGVLDLDMNGIDKHSATEPVENIVYKDLKKMPKGVYKVVVNQFSMRSKANPGFALQVEANGIVTNYQHIPAHTGRRVFLEITFDGTKFTIKNVDNVLEETSSVAKEVAGLETNNYTPVRLLMNSPNYWDGQEIGNKHVFFILENCNLTEDVRGFYNEFLDSSLEKHRKAFELLGTKTPLKITEENAKQQVSGLGFSSTVRNTLKVRVKGHTQRTFEILF